MNDYLARARLIADDVLFPAALDVELAGTVPGSHVELLAEEGFYGIVAPIEIGGAGLDLSDVLSVVEVFAGGCLATAFTWMQHHGVVLALADTDNTPLWAEYLGSAVSGRVRAGVASSGVLTRPASLRATRVADGYLCRGDVPLVSGWDGTDVVLVSASEEDSDGAELIVSALLDKAALSTGVRVHRLDLGTGRATGTVRLTFDDHLLPADRVTRQVRRAEFEAGRWFVTRVHASLALGVAGRCVRLLGEHGGQDLADAVGARLTRARARLDAALEAPDMMPGASARATELAYRAAGATVAVVGGSSVPAAQHAARLVRDATFLLGPACRPEARAGVVDLFGWSPVTSSSTVDEVIRPAAG